MKLRVYLAMAAMLIPALTFAVQKHTPGYICGFATSFNDSTVYFTDIQYMDSTYTDSKTGFLYSRDNYSYQLRGHMQKNGVANPTCITFFSKKRKDVEKKYAALKKRYATKGRYDVKYLLASDFAFTPIIPDESEMKDTHKPAKIKKSKNKK
ncbi:hypothetical protein [uncultured Prevotella sp.]|uniref:hypothetical protein n=1 Tax=uncultured Prevotella sp. TaxID=159272 RepID=UPI0027E35F61|nr:hypothetical protein [uncultured Prevotella sp.]